MRVFAILVFIGLLGAAGMVLSIRHWGAEVIGLLANDQQILQESAARHDGRGRELIVENDRRLVSMLQHKPFGWPLTPVQAQTLVHTQERLADYEAKHPGASLRTASAANGAPLAHATPLPAAKREERAAAARQREASDIARKYGPQ
jgi:hypothetical protein